MKNKVSVVLPVLFLLLFISLACSFTGNKDNSNDLLGETYRSESGGFSISKIKGYDFNDVIGIVNMTDPAGNTETGPGIMATGGISDAEYTSQELLDKMKQESSGLKISKEKKIKIGGKEGLSADVSGNYNDEEISGRVAVVMVTPTQQFTLIGLAPKDKWKELDPIFEAVLDSVKFFEPNPEAKAYEEQSDENYEQPEIESEMADVAPQDSTIVDDGTLRQWAKSAKASSQYGTQDWAASQATGEPDVETCGDDTHAWASYHADTVEWIELTYQTPVIPTEINVYQNYNPSQVVEIYMIAVNGDRYIAWSGEPESVEYCPDLMTITLDLDEDIYFNKIRVVIDQSVMGWGWDEIDAVELVGYAKGSSGAAASGQAPPAQSGAQDAPEIASDAPAPTNYSGWMAGSVYQGYMKIEIGKTRTGELNDLIGIEGTRSTDSWKPRSDHKDTYIFKLGQDNMIAWISVNNNDVVYKKGISVNTYPSDFKLSTVTKANYDKLDAIFKRDKVVTYNAVANLLESPGFLLEQILREDGRLQKTVNWYAPNGDRITGTFYDNKMTGIAGLAFIPKE